MKKIYFLFFGLCFFNVLSAQIVNIPDAKFKAKLLSASSSNRIASNQTPVYNSQTYNSTVSVYNPIDKNGDGEIQVSEASVIKYLDVNSSEIASLKGINYFTNLQFLDCSSNRLNTLDVSGFANLKTLNCSYNQLPSLNVSSLINLQTLMCFSNQLLSLNVRGLINLQYLKCSGNQLSSLNVSGLINLKYLVCESNQLSSLDVSELINLEGLYCSKNKIPNLNVSGLTNLKFLNCLDNQLSSLNVSELTNLIHLYCDNNQISSLDVSRLTNLQNLYCTNNQIPSLDVSKSHELQELFCGFNQLTSLNVNGLSNLRYLFCPSNQLTSLLIKKNNKNWLTDWVDLHFENNPNLVYICSDEKDTAFVQTLINNYGLDSFCTVNNYCSFTPGGSFYTINGTSTIDENNNGCSVNNLVYPNLKFTITDGTNSGSLISQESGVYSIPVQAGIHTITPQIENPSYFNVSPVSVTIDFPTQSSPFIQDFCITPNGTNPDLEISILPIDRARPGFDISYKLVYKNKGNTTQSGTVNLTFDDSILDLVSSNTTISSQTNKLSWNFANLKPFETKEILVVLNLNGPTETPAVNNGDVLNSTATIVSLATDKTPNDNVFKLNQVVVNSFDPNDKTCLEGSIITPSLIGEYVHYMIRFENRGTYSAQNIVVKDMIDLSKFDISTLIPTSSSHSFVTKISEGNKVEFIFENINLPFDDANNDGYIAFKIKTLPALKVGDSFTNEANIYFDYNFPILTNKATSKFQTTLGTPDFEFSNYFTLYPNPVNDVLNINAVQAIEIQSLAIYDILGQLVIAVPNAKSVSNIDVSKLRTGTYFIKVKSDKGSSSMKFIKK
ncbi:DUF7619 domain-containing protein [Flavobacterium sp. CF136]|uniref:DUF7619 domain-containing protein n=1 Tax=Flavobacterium sp. (strain CF136) TaxID=1144313 RepID=UPI000271970A|nr:leucine-rich repeat domain-containing protein [Flavobacterium sp. CF136]EJL60335.1 conserved repeat protein [Flavobacterium sp. CF136]